MVVMIKKLYEDAKIPTYGSERAACADLYAYLDNNTESVEIKPHSTVKIGTGLAMQPPENYCALIFARSGLSTNQGLAPANKVGVCDEDYRGEYKVALHNDLETTQKICHGDRIAQILFIPYEQAQFIATNVLSETKRGNGGFGSTGIQ